YNGASRYQKLRELGEDSANGRVNELATVANVDGDHWIALIVNFELRVVHYYDSLERPINAELQEAYSWWIHQHPRNCWSSLPSLHQHDGHNCGLYAANRVAYYIDPNRYPLLDPMGCPEERLLMLGRILDRHESEVSYKHEQVSRNLLII
ncbi:hypothetical protein R3P38DRAFT_2518524, partial [Favolaschia claudopus]